MDSHMEDWVFINQSSSLYHWDNSSSSSASSTPRLPLSKLPSATSSSSLKRPQLRHRHTPEATHLLSLVHAQEPISVPVPPSLQAKGRRISERSISQIPRQAWYDYNEFGTLEEKSQKRQASRRSSPPPMSVSDSRRSNSVASVLAPHHTFDPAGDAGVHASYWPSSTPYGHSTDHLPSQPLLIPLKINNIPPPLSLPSPVLPSSF